MHWLFPEAFPQTKVMHFSKECKTLLLGSNLFKKTVKHVEVIHFQSKGFLPSKTCDKCNAFPFGSHFLQQCLATLTDTWQIEHNQLLTLLVLKFLSYWFKQVERVDRQVCGPFLADVDVCHINSTCDEYQDWTQFVATAFLITTQQTLARVGEIISWRRTVDSYLEGSWYWQTETCFRTRLNSEQMLFRQKSASFGSEMPLKGQS